MAEPIHIGHIIQEELRSQGRSVTWLSLQLGTSRMACYRLFHNYSIDTQVLFRISGLLGRDFFVEYSHNLNNVRQSETKMIQIRNKNDTIQLDVK